MNTKIFTTLAVFTTAFALSAEEFYISNIKIQRVSEAEMAENIPMDEGELVYSKNSDDSVSLWITTEDENIRITDKNAIHHYQPYIVDRSRYNYTWDCTYDQSKIILIEDGVYSMLNQKVNNNWRYSVDEGSVWAKSTNTLYVYVPHDVKIYKFKYDTESKVRPSIEINNELHYVKVTATAAKEQTPPGSSTTPTYSCIISNLTVYAMEKLESTVIDVTQNDISIVDSEGSWSLNKIRSTIRNKHEIQDRWSYYPAVADVKMGSSKLKFSSENYITGDGNNVVFTGSFGKILEYNGGVGSGWDITQIDMKTSSDHIILYVDAAVGQKVTVKRSVNGLDSFSVVDPATYVDTYPDTELYDGVPCYKLTIPLTENATSEFYTLSVQSVEPYIGLYTEKFYIGTNHIEYGKVQITDINGNNYETLGRLISSSDSVLDNIAPLYSDSTIYTNGNYCIYSGLLYECTNYTGSASSFIQNNWKRTTVTEIVGNISSILHAVNGGN